MRRALLAGAQIAVFNHELAVSNEELQRSNAELEQFAYVASHDLSAPLRAVAGFSQLLASRYKGRLDADADEFIHHMQQGVNRMQRIIDDLLAYSRVGRGGLAPEPVDLDAVLDQVLAGLGADIAEHDAVIERSPLGRVSGEPGQLSQVLQNLVSNAMKFTSDGVRPRVSVSSRPEGDRLRVFVRDNGIGIAPEQAEQIFRMFQRLHGEDDYEGTGIGLAIAQKIVERHGGSIRVEPGADGGTEFSFDLPTEPATT
jgi:light-regulated signal transduction histidine kinase (bacteriophytochrome)